jgi:hypothetical protein
VSLASLYEALSIQHADVFLFDQILDGRVSWLTLAVRMQWLFAFIEFNITRSDTRTASAEEATSTSTLPATQMVPNRSMQNLLHGTTASKTPSEIAGR